MDFGLKDKTAIISGGASSIGYETSLAFAREGANIAIVDIDEAQANYVAERARTFNVRVMVIPVDVTKYKEVEEAFNTILAEFQKVDILVNVVGGDKLIDGKLPLFTETTPELWDELIALNIKSNYNWTRVVLPHMIEQAGGTIVNIGSDAGRIGEFREAVYSGCKASIIAFSKAIAREVGRYGIRVNVACPSLIAPPADTAQLGEKSGMKKVPYPPEVYEKVFKGYPLRKGPTARDLANTVLFLASDVASGDITGQTISVDGGFTML